MMVSMTSTVMIAMTVSRVMMATMAMSVLDGHLGVNSHNGLTRFFAPKTSQERFNLSGDLFGGRHKSGSGPGDAFPHPQQCRYMVYKGAYLRDLHSGRQSSG